MQGATQTDGRPSRPPSFCYVLTVEDFSQAAEDSSSGEGGTEQLTFAIAFDHTNFLFLFIHVIVITLHKVVQTCWHHKSTVHVGLNKHKDMALIYRLRGICVSY